MNYLALLMIVLSALSCGISIAQAQWQVASWQLNTGLWAMIVFLRS
jgi:hypothetical protein